MQTISSLTWGGGRRLHFRNSLWSVTLRLSSFLCQHRHTGACHLAVEFFMLGAFAWSQLAVTPSCARLNAAQRSEVLCHSSGAEQRWKNARLLGLSMQELSCFKGWPVTFLTTGQYEAMVGFIYIYRKESHFRAIAAPAQFIFESTPEGWKPNQPRTEFRIILLIFIMTRKVALFRSAGLV